MDALLEQVKLLCQDIKKNNPDAPAELEKLKTKIVSLINTEASTSRVVTDKNPDRSFSYCTVEDPPEQFTYYQVSQNNIKQKMPSLVYKGKKEKNDKTFNIALKFDPDNKDDKRMSDLLDEMEGSLATKYNLDLIKKPSKTDKKIFLPSSEVQSVLEDPNQEIRNRLIEEVLAGLPPGVFNSIITDPALVQRGIRVKLNLKSDIPEVKEAATRIEEIWKQYPIPSKPDSTE